MNIGNFSKIGGTKGAPPAAANRQFPSEKWGNISPCAPSSNVCDNMFGLKSKKQSNGHAALSSHFSSKDFAMHEEIRNFHNATFRLFIPLIQRYVFVYKS